MPQQLRLSAEPTRGKGNLGGCEPSGSEHCLVPSVDLTAPGQVARGCGVSAPGSPPPFPKDLEARGHAEGIEWGFFIVEISGSVIALSYV
jgi:hypothetical protein